MSGGRRKTLVALVVGLVFGAGVAGAAAFGVVRYLDSGAPDQAFDAPHYVREDVGIDHTYDGEFEYFVGGGVAVGDCDGDFKPDVFLAGGENPSALYRNESAVAGPIRFVKVDAPETELTGVTGAYPLDIDSDGLVDFAVLRMGENVLLRGTGDCRFELANDLWGIGGGDDWTVAFSATWEDGETLPTLAFGNYVELEDDGSRTGRCSDHQLFRPQGVVYGPQEVLTPGWCTLSILFSDWDRTGQSDLRMTNDRHYYRDGEEQLWQIRPGEPARLYGRDEGWQPMKIWGMGIASYDLTGDGLPEVFLTSQSDNKLQTLVDPSAPHYEDIAFRLGATAHRPYAGDVNSPSTAWHPQFEDVNSDGLVDLFVSKGNVEAMPDYAARDPNNLMLQNPDGTFTEAAEAAGIVDFGRSRGAALADLNLDGMLDLVVVIRREKVAVWRNSGWGDASSPLPMGNWIALRVQQSGANRDAIGAWIEVKVGRRIQQRELTVGGGHASGILSWIHFGLGDATSAEVRVRWPDGEVGPWMNAGANEFLFATRGESELRIWEEGS